MDRFGIILRSIVFFLFPIPFLLGFAQHRGHDWTGVMAYVAVLILVVAAIVVGQNASRREPD